MRLIINPEIDYVWLDKSTLQVTFQNGHSIQINELPLETQKIFTRLDGITSISQIFIEFGIDERIHSEIQESFSFLIKNRILIIARIFRRKNLLAIFYCSKIFKKSIVKVTVIITTFYWIYWF